LEVNSTDQLLMIVFLKYMLTSAGEALGITKDLPEEENNPIGILNHIFQRISLYKMPQ
jgi:hypothetical protein